MKPDCVLKSFLLINKSYEIFCEVFDFSSLFVLSFLQPTVNLFQKTFKILDKQNDSFTSESIFAHIQKKNQEDRCKIIQFFFLNTLKLDFIFINPNLSTK